MRPGFEYSVDEEIQNDYVVLPAGWLVWFPEQVGGLGQLVVGLMLVVELVMAW